MTTLSPSSKPIWLTTAELAERWRLSARTLERWRAEPRGPAWHAVGGHVLYRLEDVLAHEASCRRTGG